MSRYTAFFEQTSRGYCAPVPDLPGCIAAGATLDETRQLIRKAIEFHIESMKLDGGRIPQPATSVEQADVSAGPGGTCTKAGARR